MSPEVPIIVLILGIPLYFICVRILRKLKVGTENNRKYLALIPTLVLSPLVYVGIIMMWVLAASYYPDRNFDPNEWKSNPEERYEMSKDLIESKRLIGKTRIEVVQILGSETTSHGENHISYELGYVPGMINIDPDYLDIYFENGKVYKVEQH